MTDDAQNAIRFDQLPELIGNVVKGDPFVLTREDVDLFERGTWIDRVYTEESPEFPETLIEGFHLLAMLDAALKMAQPIDTGSMWGLNYGLDGVRFIAPVHIGDRIVAEYEIVAVVPKDLGYKVLRRCTLTVEGTSSPAVAADWWTFMLSRGTLEAGRRESVDPSGPADGPTVTRGR